MSEVTITIPIEDIVVGDGRDVNSTTVKRLAQSIEQIGLQHPITVKRLGDRYKLIAGRHRLEATKKIGRDFILAHIVKMNSDESRLWEISENLHRAELTKLDRDEQIAEWIRITERVSTQVAAKPQGGRPEGGVRAASRELGIDEDDGRRAMKVASLSDEAKEAAREENLDDNRSALLAAAREDTPEKQVAKISEIAAAKIVKPQRIADDPLNDFETIERQVVALMAAWNKAGPEAREQFMSRIERSVMDLRYARG